MDIVGGIKREVRGLWADGKGISLRDREGVGTAHRNADDLSILLPYIRSTFGLSLTAAASF